MGRVADVLRIKGSEVFTISADQSVYEAIVSMVEHKVGALLVLTVGKPSGIVTERDYLREVAVRGRTSRETLVEEIMTREVVVVDSSRSIEECMAIMTARRIRHLPVVDDGRLSGLISIGDLVKRRVKEQDVELQYLTDYITGKYPA